MKHIKAYTLFERVSKETKIFESTEVDNLKEDIKDIFLELEDIGFTVNLSNSTTRFPFGLDLEIMNKSGALRKEFSLKEILDSIITLTSYLNDTDYYYIQDVTAKGISDMGRELEKYIGFILDLDPNIDVQENNDKRFNTSLTYVELKIRKK